MKGAFELAFIMMFSMPMLVLGINFVQIMMAYNQARFLQDYSISVIEHQNRLDDYVYQLIDEKALKYPDLTMDIRKHESRYQVKVTFPVEIPMIGYKNKGSVVTDTQIIR